MEIHSALHLLSSYKSENIDQYDTYIKMKI